MGRRSIYHQKLSKISIYPHNNIPFMNFAIDNEKISNSNFSNINNLDNNQNIIQNTLLPSIYNLIGTINV